MIWVFDYVIWSETDPICLTTGARRRLDAVLERFINLVNLQSTRFPYHRDKKEGVRKGVEASEKSCIDCRNLFQSYTLQTRPQRKVVGWGSERIHNARKALRKLSRSLLGDARAVVVPHVDDLVFRRDFRTRETKVEACASK